MRVLSLGLLLACAFISAGINNTPKTQNQHNRVLVLSQKTDLKIYGPSFIQEETQKPDQDVSLLIPPNILALATMTPKGPTPDVQAAGSGKVVTIDPPEATKSVVAPLVNSAGESQPVRITFYYCTRTVERADDGGGFCGGTAYAGLVHPGTASCPPEWHGRNFTIVNNPLDQIYTCEDSGSAVRGTHIDIWFATNGEGWSWPMHGQGTIIWQN